MAKEDCSPSWQGTSMSANQLMAREAGDLVYTWASLLGFPWWMLTSRNQWDLVEESIPTMLAELQILNGLLQETASC